MRLDQVASFIINANNSITNRRVRELAGLIQLVAHRGDGKGFVVRADEKLTAFLELERAIYELAVSATNREGINQGSA